MSHTIQISDELWEAYDASPSQMRDTLWQALLTDGSPGEPDPTTEFETPLVLRWATRCSVCRKQLLEGETAMFRVPDHGPKQIICMDDARSESELEGLLSDPA
jgi:hypothetical protein